MVREQRLDQELGKSAELHQAGTRIAVDVCFGETAKVGEFAVIFPEVFEVTRFHKGYGWRGKTKIRQWHCCLRWGFVLGKFGTHIRAFGYGTGCAMDSKMEQVFGLQHNELDQHQENDASKSICIDVLISFY